MASILLSFLLISLYKSFLIVLFSGLFILLKNRVSARVRYLTWLVLLVSLIFPFRPRFGQGLVTIEHGQNLATSTARVVSQTGTEAVVSQPNLWEMFLGLPWIELFLLVWLVGFLVVIGRAVFSYVKFRNLLKRWGNPIADARILANFQVIKEEFGIQKSIRLFHYPQVSSPMIFGLRNPIVLLPAIDYTDEELDLIFEHELTHYRHRDIYVNLLVLLVKAAHWFNPIVAFACKEVQEAAESYCDHSVLHERDQAYRSFYGETIITMIHKSQQPILLSSCFYSNKFNLKRRIISIMDSRLPKPSLAILVTLVTSCALIFSGSIFVVAMSETQLHQVQEATLTQEDAIQLSLKDQSLELSAVTNVQASDQGDYYLIEFSHEETLYRVQVDKASRSLTKIEKETLKLVAESSTSSTSTSSNQASQTASEVSSQPTVASTSQTVATSNQTQTTVSTPASTSSQVIPAPTPNPPVSTNSEEPDTDDDVEDTETEDVED
ncbi:M56 family metallopeptidase [Streptococcus suis]|uniref:M56 family metallopeptidase n=1 Tax=Streptococcus suis TaxID=1307 RepID=UPI00244BBBD6